MRVYLRLKFYHFCDIKSIVIVRLKDSNSIEVNPIESLLICLKKHDQNVEGKSDIKFYLEKFAVILSDLINNNVLKK